MIPLRYIWSRLLKKLRGVAIRDSFVHPTSKIESGTQFVSSSMDKYSFCGYDCQIINCEIGKYCSIADNVKIGGARHPIEWVGMSPVFYRGRDSVNKKFSRFDRVVDKSTKIGHDVWIGAGVFIIQGVRIGNGAVIGAGSVVTHDVENYEIVAGNPAKCIRKRFSEEVIKDLLDINWWNFTEKELEYYAQFIKDPLVFIEEVKRNKNKE